MSIPICRGLLALLLVVASVPAFATVHMPTGEFRTTHVDLRVKVLGGLVKVERSWRADNLNEGEYSWHWNPAWDRLEFEMDIISGVPDVITRGGSEFERAGNGVYIWAREYFIRAEKDAAGEVTGWRWYDRDGHWITYDSDGRVTAYGDRSGTTITFERDTQGRIHQLLDVHGEVAVTWHWSDGHMVKISDRAGRNVSYHYQGDRLTRVTDVLGHEWSYSYSGGLLTTLTDPMGHATTVAYSGNRAVRVTDALGHATDYSYAYNRVEQAYTVVVHGPANLRTERHYDASGQMISQEIGERTTYRLIKDGDHVEIAINERGGRTRTVFDANHNPVKVVYPDGTQVTSDYDSHGRLLEHTDERGVITRYEYNTQGLMTKRIEAVGLPEERITTWAYNDDGLRTSMTVHGATNAQDATTRWFYDQYGNVKKMVNSEGHATTYTHDVTGAVLTRTNALGHTWTKQTSAAGQVTAITGPMGHTRAIEYDKLGRRKTVTDALNNTTTFEYDALGRLTKVTGPLGHSTTRSYDAAGRLKTSTNAADATTSYAYDTYGRLVSLTDPAGNVITREYGTEANGLAGLLTAIQYPTYRVEYKYGPRGRRTQTIKVLPAHGATPEKRLIEASGYDATGHRISVTDPAGHTTLYEYDGLGRLIQKTDASGAVTHYAYDARDNLLTVTDAKNHTYGFSYTLTDQAKTESRPSGATITYAYDDAGRLIRRTSPGGDVRAFDYNAAGRRIETRYYPAGETNPAQTVHYSYSERGLLKSYTQTGSTHSAASYAYDARGRRIQSIITYGQGQAAFTKTLKTGYTVTGHQASFTYPDGTQVEFAYTKAGMLKSATLPGQGIKAIQWKHYQWRQPTTIVMPGAVRSLKWDALGRPNRIRSQAIGQGSAQAPTGDVIMDYRYTYNKAGQITTRQTMQGSYHYQYGPVGRLTHVTPPASLVQSPANPQPGQLPVEAYTYDPVGNRTTSLHQPGQWHYNKDNQLLSWGVGANKHAYTYNANGATATKTVGQTTPTHWRYRYNAAERLSKVERESQTVATYQYDPMGRRIKKTTAQGTTWYLYSAHGLIAELNAAGTATRYYGWKPNRPWGTDPLWLANRSGTTWQVYLYHNDHLGTPQRLTDFQGDIVWSGRTLAFGKPKVLVDAIRNPLRFPGQHHDRFTSLNYNYHRSYSPAIGRYINNDPAGLTDGPNIYAYAHSDPVNLVDPLGLWVKLCIRELKALDETPDPNSRYNPLSHWYLSVSGEIFSFQMGSNFFWSQGEVRENETGGDDECDMVCDDPRFDSFVSTAVKKVGKPTYSVAAYPGTWMYAFGARNCQTWVLEVLRLARKLYLEAIPCPECFSG